MVIINIRTLCVYLFLLFRRMGFGKVFFSYFHFLYKLCYTKQTDFLQFLFNIQFYIYSFTTIRTEAMIHYVPTLLYVSRKHFEDKFIMNLMRF